VHPVQPACYPQAGLVEPDHLGSGDAVGDLLEEPLEPVGGTVGHGSHGAFGDRGAEQLGQRLSGALFGQKLVRSARGALPVFLLVGFPGPRSRVK